MGFNQKQTVQILYAVSALLGVSSIMLVTQQILYAIIIMVVSLGISVATWIIFKDDQMKIESGLIPEKEDKSENIKEVEAEVKTENDSDNGGDNNISLSKSETNKNKKSANGKKKIKSKN